jgi:pimeloyl-ACP methyl ester carboxylesterase
VVNTPGNNVEVRGAAEGTTVPPATVSPPPQQPPSQGERIMKALAQAYPDRIGAAVFRNGDWAVPIRGVWYYYAEGRLLPQELRSRVAEYDPQSFYNYYAELPVWRTPSAEESERFRVQSQEWILHPAKRSQHFYDALWRATNRNESWDRVKSLRFLGRPVYVHYSILEELALVEELILEESKTNTQVRQWIDNLDVLDGWNWRNIAETESRSFHSYGAALDLLPASTGNLETYWLWTSRTKSDWWMVPYSQRLHPPEAVIKAFEAYGFVWGGKWTSYDTMHFEYRPEIFILNNLPLSTLR